MHDETMEKARTLCKIKDRLVSCMEAQMANGVECVDTKEAGAVVDMIKDLADAEKSIWTACYYKTVVEAMKDRDDEEERYGYNNRRYANGEYAPKGHGHASPPMGYRPMREDEGEFWDEYSRDPGLIDRIRMGYSGKSAAERMDHRYGQAYNEFKEARRHYTETSSAADKERMSEYADQHLHDTMFSIREMWKTADTDLKKRIKADLTGLVSELTV